MLSIPKATNVHLLEGEFIMGRVTTVLTHLCVPVLAWRLGDPHCLLVASLPLTTPHADLSSVLKAGPERSKTMLCPVLCHRDWSEKQTQVLRGFNQRGREAILLAGSTER